MLRQIVKGTVNCSNNKQTQEWTERNEPEGKIKIGRKIFIQFSCFLYSSGEVCIKIYWVTGKYIHQANFIMQSPPRMRQSLVTVAGTLNNVKVQFDIFYISVLQQSEGFSM